MKSTFLYFGDKILTVLCNFLPKPYGMLNPLRILIQNLIPLKLSNMMMINKDHKSRLIYV